MNNKLHQELLTKFSEYYGTEPTVAAWAPGRIEVLGNHTDYNEGFVLSAAVNLGTLFIANRATDDTCRVVAGDLMDEATFTVRSPTPSSTEHQWAKYVVGVLAGLSPHGNMESGFNGMFLSNLPLAAGLSSSAALEISAALAICSLYGIKLADLDLAKICQTAEHEFAGVKCGLLDQLSSIFGRAGQLVMSDFRSLDVGTVPVSENIRFLVCNTGVKHTLIDSEYNERHAKCKEAASFFNSVLTKPVRALRDVTWEEWKKFSGQMEPTCAKRAAHVIGENTRVLKAKQLLTDGQLEEFGRLMFESHESSVRYFDNSCSELDFLVNTARSVPCVFGARLSGAGFGGSAVVLVQKDKAEAAGSTLAEAYRKEFGSACKLTHVRISDGARVIE